MKKLYAAFVVMLCACLMCTYAFAADVEAAESELNETANFVMDTMLAEKVAADDYSATYDDVYRAMLCLKAGVDNEEVYMALDDAIAKAYEESESLEGFIGSQGEYHYAYAVALSILYLQERDIDVTDYCDDNLLEVLEDVYLSTDVTAYGHQVVAGVVNNYPDYDWSDVNAKMKETVLGYYEDGQDGCGMNYWGISADNNGMMFPALLSMIDDEIFGMVEKSMETMMGSVDESGAIVSWGAPNVDSTALALKFAASFGFEEEADAFFAALAQFEDADIPGAYAAYGSYDYSTTDVFYGLSQYVASLNGRYFLDFVDEEEPVDDPVDDPIDEPVDDPVDEINPTEAPSATPTETPSAAPTEAAKDDKDKSPKTADNFSLALVLILMASVSGLVISKKQIR